MRIGVITEISVDRKAAWSGTMRSAGEALHSAGAKVEFLDAIMERQTRTLNALGKAMLKVGLADPMINHSQIVSRRKALALQKRLDGTFFDVLFAPAGSALIGKMPLGLPIIYCSDATIPLMESYYDGYCGMFGASNARARAIEKAALERADLLVYPTWWAANSAINDFGVDPSRIIVQPFGANLTEPPSREEVMAPRKPGPLRLLFCGVEWARKGGDIALETIAALVASGLEAELTILGVKPPAGTVRQLDLAKFVTVIPFLNKTLPEDRARFREIFLDADILILPTKAECYGMVFCEAAACGTVSFATATGGVSEVVKDGETGRVLTPGSTGADFAKEILGMVRSPGILTKFKQSARTDYEERLNWKVWGAAVLERSEKVLLGSGCRRDY